MSIDVLSGRRGGILLHLTSLPSPHGIGDLGPAARAFADWCSRTGFTVWQVLPVNPIGPGNSPYSGKSAFAIEPLLLSLEDLHDGGLLPATALRPPRVLRCGAIRYREVRRFKEPRIHAAFQRWSRKGGLRSTSFRAFCRAQSHWLDDWCADRPGNPDEHAFSQFMLDKQWRRLRSYAANRGVGLIGDVPIFVHADSTDVRTRPDLFRLTRRGTPTVVTGVPPDDFCRDGQLWGHPHYDWASHRREGFQWWIDRFRRALELFDAIRIDHFIGFVRLYEVSARAKTARRGVWRRSPGRAILKALQRALGPLPIIAEDLGAVTPAVRRLRDDFGLPGMRIAQWGWFREGSPDAPANHPEHCVCYPGTHDNDTARGWFRTLPPDARRRFADATGCSRAASAPGAMIKACLASPARLRIIPMQDLLGLGSAARMNRPGTPRGNWRWRLDRIPEETLSGLDGILRAS
ncbi:MAG: 4-alpha-glucanotransferase [Phycisphaerales bacterium]|nr:4-alpha-glucanotransferase [Phycisphaerales bacterium]